MPLLFTIPRSPTKTNSCTWAERHKLTGLVELQLGGRTLVLQRQAEKIARAFKLAGCYVVTTNVLKASMSAQQVHDSYVSLQRVERDFGP